MLHKISAFCDKIDSIKKMSDDLRVLKYNTPKSNERDFKINNLIESIQADCLLVGNDKGTYEKGNFDYSGIDHDHDCSAIKKVKMVNMKSIRLVLLLGLSLVFLTNCSSINRSQIGAVLGSTTTTAGCVSVGVSDPYAVATCAVVGHLQVQKLCTIQIMMYTMPFL